MVRLIFSAGIQPSGFGVFCVWQKRNTRLACQEETSLARVGLENRDQYQVTSQITNYKAVLKNSEFGIFSRKLRIMFHDKVNGLGMEATVHRNKKTRLSVPVLDLQIALGCTRGFSYKNIGRKMPLKG